MAEMQSSSTSPLDLQTLAAEGDGSDALTAHFKRLTEVWAVSSSLKCVISLILIMPFLYLPWTKSINFAKTAIDRYYNYAMLCYAINIDAIISYFIYWWPLFFIDSIGSKS
jgi:hypothetical protein